MAGKKLILDGWYSIGTGHESDIDDLSREKFGPRGTEPEYRRIFLREGLIDKEGEVTQKGWDLLNEDIGKLERNVFGWLRKSLDGARDEGHGDSGDLIGGFWFDAHNPKQLEIVVVGVENGINESDFDLDLLAWKDLSDFGTAILNVNIYLNVDKEVLDKALAKEAWERTERQRDR